MKIGDIGQMPEYFDRYISYVPENMALKDALSDLGIKEYEQQISTLKSVGDQVYAHQKWTIKQMLQHIIDTERIFAYRALRFARRDTTILPGFDENAFADAAPAILRTLDDLMVEWICVRDSTKQLFNSFSDEDLAAEGQTFAGSTSVLALGFTIVGHPLHHMTIIHERYFPLLSK